MVQIITSEPSNVHWTFGTSDNAHELVGVVHQLHKTLLGAVAVLKRLSLRRGNMGRYAEVDQAATVFASRRHSRCLCPRDVRAAARQLQLKPGWMDQNTPRHRSMRQAGDQGS
ncbi:hypothetical protein PG991_012384 [Apiospora marii]|uniref:Uncharacterized protein n=1 Tax=Apiospora marii TaxID=335849 RepID=A0ABR1RA34_9PEZI